MPALPAWRRRRGRISSLNLEFPSSARAANGATLRYRVQARARDGGLQRLANCVIPRTPKAVRMMNRQFTQIKRWDRQGGPELTESSSFEQHG